MGTISDLVRTLVSVGATPEMILAAVETAETAKDAALETGREKARARFHKWKANNPANVSKRQQTLANDSKQLAGGEDNSSKKEITEKEERKKEALPSARVNLEAFKAELSPILDAARLDAICDVRRKKGATFSAHAGQLLSKALLLCPNVADAADEMVLRNWTGIKPEWLEQRKSTAPPAKRMNAVEANMSRRIQKNESASGRRDNGDVELLPPDRPELRNLIGNAGQAMRWPSGSGNH